MQRQSRALGGNPNEGPPQVHKWLTPLDELIEHPKIEEQPEVFHNIKAYRQPKFTDASVTQVANSVKFFKLKAFFKGEGKKSDEYKSHISFAHEEVEFLGTVGMAVKTRSTVSIFLEAFAVMGFEQKVGPGPAGQMERLVQAWLDKLKK